jgi:hypothetical protein
MTRLSFMSGVAAALVLALVASVTFTIAQPFTGTALLLRLLISGLGFLYVVWLVRGCRKRSGRLSAIAFWVLIPVCCWLFALSLPIYLLVHVSAIWLIRSLLLYSGALPALLDLGLTGLSAIAASWSIWRTGSVFLATWIFFLIQALFVAIPSRIPGRRRRPNRDIDLADSAFERARRRAEAALTQLVSRAGH